MSRSYDIELKNKAKLKIKYQHRIASTQTPNSTFISHINAAQQHETVVAPFIGQSTPSLHHNKQKKHSTNYSYLRLPPLYTNQHKIEAFRQKLSLCFRQLHNQPQIKNNNAASQIKYDRSLGKSLMAIKARMMTESIYEEQLRDYRQEKRLLIRIRERLQLLKNINEQKSELMHSYLKSSK